MKLYGGMKLIGQPDNDGYELGTAAIVLEVRGTAYLVTAGHVVGRVGRPVYTVRNERDDITDVSKHVEIGRVTHNLELNAIGDLKYDLAAVQLNEAMRREQVCFSQVDLLDLTRVRTMGGWNDARVDDILDVVGIQGGHRSVKVTEVGGTLLLGGGRGLGVSKAKITAGVNFTHGDSGGPVCRENQIVGVNIGDGGQGAGTCFFAPFIAIAHSLDLSRN